MSCNQDNDYLASVSVAGSMVDGYKKSIGADIGVGKYAKLGNILIITQIAGHANHGEWGNVVQDIGVAVATPLIVTALLLASASVLAVTATGIAVSYALNGIID